MDDEPPIEKEIFIEAPPEEVFPYLTESGKYLLWMGVAAELDARPGGIFKVDPNGRDVVFGEFIEVVRPHRVVFTWGWKEPGHPLPAGSSRVEIELHPHDRGTRLRLRHFGVPGTLRERHDGGWDHYLGRLKMVVAGRDPGPDPYCVPEHRHA
jgi:uncharacterized protein YndB with AHSA1/START domain